MSHSEVIDLIRGHHRERCFAMSQRKRLDLALGSFLRLMLGWRKDLPEAERKVIAADAARMMDECSGPWADTIAATVQARQPFEAIEANARKEMGKLAKQLPVWADFGEDIRGFGEVSLAVIVAEAGDLSNYATDAKLWKRMGVAVIEGRRQGNPGENATKEDWIEHGYRKPRRSHLWNIGQSLIKGNRDGVYRVAYDRRRAHTMVTHPEWWCDEDGNPKVDKTGKPSSAHGAADAQRYMEKRLLRDLWRAWRRAEVMLARRPNDRLPAAPIHEAAA